MAPLAYRGAPLPWLLAADPSQLFLPLAGLCYGLVWFLVLLRAFAFRVGGFLFALLIVSAARALFFFGGFDFYLLAVRHSIPACWDHRVTFIYPTDYLRGILVS